MTLGGTYLPDVGRFITGATYQKLVIGTEARFYIEGRILMSTVGGHCRREKQQRSVPVLWRVQVHAGRISVFNHREGKHGRGRLSGWKQCPHTLSHQTLALWRSGLKAPVCTRAQHMEPGKAESNC